MARQKTAIIAIGGVVYRQNDSGQIEILLIKKRDGFWTLPKGKVEPHETHVAALVREIFEETGVTGIVEAPVRTVSYTIIKKGKRCTKIVTYYLMLATAGQARPRLEEGIEHVGWFPVSAALQQIGRNRVRKVARKASSLLRQWRNAPSRSHRTLNLAA